MLLTEMDFLAARLERRGMAEDAQLVDRARARLADAEAPPVKAALDLSKLRALAKQHGAVDVAGDASGFRAVFEPDMKSSQVWGKGIAFEQAARGLGAKIDPRSGKFTARDGGTYYEVIVQAATDPPPVVADHLNPGAILRWNDGRSAFVVETGEGGYKLSDGSTLTDEQIDAEVQAGQLEILSPEAVDVAEELAEVAEELETMGQPVVSEILDAAIEAWALEAPGRFSVLGDFEGFDDERATSGEGIELLREVPSPSSSGLPAAVKAIIERAAPGKVYQTQPATDPRGVLVRLHRFTPREVNCIVQDAQLAGVAVSTGNENHFPWRELYFGDFESAAEQAETHLDRVESQDVAVPTQREGVGR